MAEDIQVNIINVIKGLSQLTKENQEVRGLGNSISSLKSKMQANNAVAGQMVQKAEKLGVSVGALKSKMAAANVVMNEQGKFLDGTSLKKVSQAQINKHLAASLRVVALEMRNGAAMAKMAGNMSVSVDQLRQSLSQLNLVLKQNGQLYSSITGKKIKNQTRAQQQLNQQTKRFRMELLSIMFFGMAIARMFGAMTAGSLEAAGAQSVWSTLTMMVGLPAAMKMTDWLLKLYAAYDKLPGPIHTVISWFMFIGQALATLLMGIGIFALGWLGLAKMVPWLGPAIAEVGTAINGVMTKFGGWAKVFTKIGGVLSIVWGAFRAFGGYMKKDWWKIISGVALAVAGIIALVMGGWIPLAIGAAVVALVWLGDRFKKVAAIIMATATPLLALFDLLVGIKDIFTGKGFQGFKFTKGLWAQMGTKWGGGEAAGSLTSLARGGIVTNPTPALIGEAGPEAVIPLNQAGGIGGINFNPEINITTGPISNSVDINSIAQKVSEVLYTDLRRLGVR